MQIVVSAWDCRRKTRRAFGSRDASHGFVMFLSPPNRVLLYNDDDDVAKVPHLAAVNHHSLAVLPICHDVLIQHGPKPDEGHDYELPRV